jgi:hypothetical protein
MHAEQLIVPATKTRADTLERSFLKRAYPTMKKNNPNTPILIREATGTSPRVWARYGYGKEKSETLEGTYATNNQRYFSVAHAGQVCQTKRSKTRSQGW